MVSLLFSMGQTAIKLLGAEAADRAQCAAPVKPLFLSVFEDWYSVPFVKNSQKWPLVYQSSHLYPDCTNSVPIVKNSQKTVKLQKSDHWCTNRHVYTESGEYTKSALCIRVHVRRIHKAVQTPLPCETARCLGSGHSPSPMGRVDCMCSHRRPCVWLPLAAACSYSLV